MVEIGPREGFGGPQPTIILSRRDEPEKGKSRLHIDVNATDRDQDAELERLLQLGARPADIGQTGQESWHVLADPEGNEFACSGPASTRFDATRGRNARPDRRPVRRAQHVADAAHGLADRAEPGPRRVRPGLARSRSPG